MALRRGCLSRRLREAALRVSGGTESLTEGTASAKSQRDWTMLGVSEEQ